MTPTPALFEGHAKRLYKHHEHRLSRERKISLPPLDRSMVEDEELRGGLDVQHRPLFFIELRVIAATASVCERIASELRAEEAENRLVERGTAVRHGLARALHKPRAARGGQPPAFIPQGRVRLDGARGHLAPAFDRLRDRPVRTRRPPASARAAGDPATR